MFLEHGELWDEHLVDDVHDAVVRDHVRLMLLSVRIQLYYMRLYYMKQ